MKIIKYKEFILEGLNDTPETYIETKLMMIKKKIEGFFDETVDEKDISYKDMNITLDSCDISKFSKLYDSLTVKYSDPDNAYTLIILIDIKEAIAKPDVDFNLKDIKKCYIKFKKYDLNTFDIIGQISKNIEIGDINKDLLIDLKVELDDIFENDDDFKIET